LGSTRQDLPSDSPAACRSACRRRQASLYTRIPPTNDPRGHAAYPGRPRGRAGHCPTTSHDDGQGPHRRLGWPSTACASFKREAPTQADHEPVMDAAGDHPDPGHPSHTAACPTAALHLTSAGHSGRGNPQTPDAHTGRRRADVGQRTPGRSDARTGHWTPVPWTGKRGHWSPDTGHCTPDAGRGRGQADEGAAGIRTSWATTPSDRTLGRPTVFLWTAPAALDSPCRLGGEAAFQREIASRRQLLGRSAGVERRLGALLSSDDFGSSVEPAVKLHPLWQGARRDRHKLEQARSGFDQGVVSELRAVYSGVRCAGVGWRRRGE
jgi:hypothetical protein